MKVAFLFLVLDGPNFPAVWDAYFKGNESLSNVYIHPKYAATWRPERVISELHETGWGYIIPAYLALFSAAFADPENSKFIVVSESCVPVKLFAAMYARVMADPAESFMKPMKIKRYDREARLTPAVMAALGERSLVKHYARMCLSRPDVRRLLYKYNRPILKLFSEMHVGDEFFLSAISPIKRCTSMAIVFDDWGFVDAQTAAIKTKIRRLYEDQEKRPNTNHSAAIENLQKQRDEVAKSPKTIHAVSREDLRSMKATRSFFYRKFAKDSNVEKYALALISED
jgi:hypothetical protein